MNGKPTTTMLVIGTIVFIVTIAAWLIAEFNHVPTGALLAFSVPVVAALFLANNLNRTAEAAQQAAAQTNGALDARIKAGVAAGIAEQLPAIEQAAAAANAKRDAARTRQAQGDISHAAASTTDLRSDTSVNT